jgi:hypothetical protein
MSDTQLFPDENIIGMFTGFLGCGTSLEFHADLVLPYRRSFQYQPMQGHYLLVQLATPDEALLGRIVSLGSDGDLTSSRSEDENLRVLREVGAISEQEREQKLKYRVNLQILGVLRKDRRHVFTFVASHRRLPPLGSPVAFPSGDVLREIAGHHLAGTAIGHLALGEYIYATSRNAQHEKCTYPTKKEDWMQLLSPEILIHFPVENLIARRSFIFARAGFGKSNLNKLFFSELYKQMPTVLKRGKRRVPVGTLLFDPDGEYFWPDDKGRPGLCDVPGLQDQLVVFTPKEAPSPFYQSFVAGGMKLDLRRLSAVDVLSLALAPHKQGQQNVQKIKGLKHERWIKLVDLIAAYGHQASLSTISRLLHLDKQKAEALAARANMTTVVQTLHDPHSHLLEQLQEALSAGKLCVLDLSQLHDAQALVLSGLLLQHLFQFNQQEFTKAQPRSIPIIAVIEEAQSVLNGKTSAAEPFICWVKEGRKYDLGTLLITQQPGSLPPEILSQGDNWFVLHLLSAVDLKTLQKANAYFSQDILCMLLGEPLPGHAVFWSSVGGKPYPVSLRVLSFEQSYQQLDPDFQRAEISTAASALRTKFATADMPAVTPDDDGEAEIEDAWEGEDKGDETGEDPEEWEDEHDDNGEAEIPEDSEEREAQTGLSGKEAKHASRKEPVLFNKPFQCPYCGSDALARDGHANGKQKYLCHTCRRRHSQKPPPLLPVQSGAMKGERRPSKNTPIGPPFSGSGGENGR